MPRTTLSSLFFQQTRAAEQRRNRIHAPVYAVVTNNNDPDKLGRVKVKIASHAPDEDESTWAPVVSVGAGDDRGWYFLPEVDDEVLVMFEHGDITRPVVVGLLWNDTDAAPESNGGGNERKVLVSREGSKITFDDDAGTVTLEDGGGIGKILIEDSGNITIESGTNDVGFNGDSEINIVANKIELVASMKFEGKGGMGAMLTGGTTVKLESSGMVEASAASLNVNQAPPKEAQAASDSAANIPDPVA